MRSVYLLVALFAPVLLLPSLAAQDKALRDKEAGVEIQLPGKDWKQKDLSASGVVVHVYSPAREGMLPRVTVMRYPKLFLREGMKTRAKQVEAAAAGVRRRRLEKDKLGGREAVAYVYDVAGIKTEERCVELQDAWLIVQVAAKEQEWRQQADTYARVFASVKLLRDAGAPKALRVRSRTPAQIRADRAKLRPGPRRFAVMSHDIRLDLHPDRGSLQVRDDLVVEGRGGPLTRITFICSHVEVDGATHDGRKLGCRRTSPQTVEVQLAEPLQKGQRLRLCFTAHSDDYRFAQDQSLVAEVAVLGQVTAATSFSTHVCYYPIDRQNDAVVDIRISVPAGYTAVTGGEALGPTEEEKGDRRVFRYRASQRTPRALPFGFAAGKFERLTARTKGGIDLEFYFPKGKEKQARQRLDVAVESGTLLEDLMGPLPWKRVAFCHVQPFRKETGVSLPGLILLSDGFFRDAEGVQLRGDQLDDPQSLGLMLIADELSHQWNFYAVPLPNELAEGVSTFTNLLWLGKRVGPSEYRKGIDYCARAYLAVAAGNEDVAVADPALYRSPVYRVVAFCKVPAILDLLRQRLGEAAFRRSWRETFTGLRGRNVGYAEFARAFGKAAKQDLAAFFEQWLFQPGHPQLSVRWQHALINGQNVVMLEVEQTQPAALFDLVLNVTPEASGAAPTRSKTQQARVTKRKETLVLRAAGPVNKLRVEPAWSSPLIEVTVVRKQ